MNTLKLIRTIAAITFCFSVSTGDVFAQERAFTEGPVVNVSRIRTINGHFDDYMNYVAGVWKKSQDAAKKAGYILDYQVMVAEPRNENEPDVVLVITYKNWAALDGSFDKGDAIAKLVEGSVEASSRAFGDRDKIRRVLGSETMQVLNLK